MSTYQIADGHDQAGSLAAIIPQPKSPGVQQAKRVFAASAVYDTGVTFCLWVFTALTEAEYTSLLSQCGLSSAVTNEVTIKTTETDDRTTWTDYNGLIIKPFNPKFDAGYYRDVEFMIRELVAPS
jgi:hypothetical protein